MADTTTKHELYLKQPFYASMGTWTDNEGLDVRVRRASPETDQIDIHLGGLLYISLTVADWRELAAGVNIMFPETVQ